ncbi:MAG TPA: hypothetical protein VGC97_19620 [Pyrinomonadaceae bacterium]|jgi:hypothetical protein
MPKFQNLNEAFWHIRENSLEYLPEKSLKLFNAFWIGYEWRYEVEFKEFKGFELLDGFHEFMCVKYRVPSNRNSMHIAELYTQNQAEAFDLWFADLEEFLSKKDGTTDIEKYYAERRNEDLFASRKEIDFFGLIKILEKRIAMYVGSNSFTLLTFILSGWMRATQDFGLEESEQEKIFKNFQKYIEDRPFWLRAENSDLPPKPTWSKIILEWTAHIQKEEKALEMFAEYFGEFAFQGKGCVDYVEFHWKSSRRNFRKI